MEHKLELGARDARGILEPEYGQKTGEPRLEGQPVAIIVTHGMGQQVPYETIEDVAQAVWRRVQDPSNDDMSPRSLIRRVRLGIKGKDEVETELVRAEIQIEHEQKTFDVHIYEAYWAPLTEGKVTLKEVVWFLIDAGWNGIKNTEARKGYQRWMFNGLQTFDLPMARKIGLTLTLAFLLLLIVSLIFMNAVLAAAAASHAIGASSSFPPNRLITPLTADFIVADIAALLILLVTVILRRLPSWIGWALIGLAALMILLAGFFMPFQLAGFAPQKWLWMWPNGWAQRLGSIPLWGGILLTILWGGELIGAYGVRWCLIEYVGDVTAYIAAHTVSKFYELRQQIWQTAMKVARAVYRAQTNHGPDAKFLYHKIIMVGHSLGSVIGYDVLNGLLLEEAFSNHALDVAKRTRMFLTFGSPLDKTDFLFRTQADMCSSVREVAAAAVQPMIQNYDNRPEEWVNLYSKSDIISGHLDFYDPPNKSNARNKTQFLNPKTAPVPDPRAVNNKPDPDARTPLAAHVEYWTGKLFAEELVRAITT